MSYVDLAAQFGLDVQLYSLSLDDNTQTQIPTGVVNPGVYPYAVELVAANFPSGVVLESWAWTVDADFMPLVTAQFTSNTDGIYCTIAVLYKK